MDIVTRIIYLTQFHTVPPNPNKIIYPQIAQISADFFFK